MGKIIAFIPVRGGSKSIPFKNIKSFCGKPLVYWSISALEDVPDVDEIIIATDCKKIEETVAQFQFKKTTLFKRSAKNASDSASTESVLLEYLDAKQYSDDDILILVQATSPMTESIHFYEGITKFKTERMDSLLTCVRNYRFFWNEDGSSKNYDYMHRPRRQDFRGELMENGAFYINLIGNIKNSRNRLSGKIGIYEMPEHTAYEIDEPDDWTVMENLMYRHVISRKKLRKKIKLFLTDVDGVLTDAGMYYSENGDELKKFNTRDGMAFQLLREAGIKTGIITSEITKIVEKRASKLNVDYLYQGKRGDGKMAAAIEICDKEGISLEEVAYIGDDINCLDLLNTVAVAGCPADATSGVKNINGIFIMNNKGGNGAMREFVDNLILANY